MEILQLPKSAKEAAGGSLLSVFFFLFSEIFHSSTMTLAYAAN